VRKKGKLPGEVVGVEYVKDYGVDEFEMKGDGFEGLGEKPKVNLISNFYGP
jgi:adenine/guanine phosphoribosyltransferase-like PRPP-binding protein